MLQQITLLLDENVPFIVFKRLMAKGYNVRYVTDIAPPGITDEKLAEIAIEHRATIITQDANFTQLKKTSSEKVKIIYLKLLKPARKRIAPSRIYILPDQRFNNGFKSRRPHQTLVQCSAGDLNLGP